MFDAAHIHVMIVHLPIIGTALAMIPLLWWVYRHDVSIKWIGLIILVISIIGIPLATSSGEGAGNAFFDGTMVEKLDSASTQALKIHSEAAELAEGFWFFIGALIMLQLILWKREYAWKHGLFWMTIIANIFLIIWLSYVGYLGGQIRHPEFRLDVPPETHTSLPNIAQ